MKKRRDRRLRLLGALVAMAVVLGPISAVVGAVPASAAAPGWVDCVRSGFLPTSIEGKTLNLTRVQLTRTASDKTGFESSWAPEPAAVIAPKNVDHWCVNAVLGLTMRVEYATPDGSKVEFRAAQNPLASPTASCQVSGPSAPLLECRAEIHKTRFDDSSAMFTLTGAGDAGGQLPTLSCASLFEQRVGFVLGDLCSGVAIGFHDAARLVETSRDRKEYLCAEVNVTQERMGNAFFLVLKAHKCARVAAASGS
jgi:hypothetical protein